MPKIEINFPADFDSDKVLPLQIGRIIIGKHIARLMFTTKGEVTMYIDKSAVEDGSIILTTMGVIIGDAGA